MSLNYREHDLLKKENAQLRITINELHNKIDQLQITTNAFPKTADGKVFVRDMKVFLPLISSNVIYQATAEYHIVESGGEYVGMDTDFLPLWYSTREAAEAALK